MCGRADEDVSEAYGERLTVVTSNNSTEKIAIITQNAKGTASLCLAVSFSIRLLYNRSVHY